MVMKITERQLRRIIRESLQEIAPRTKGPGNQHLIVALRNTWDEVRRDVGISNPTAEEKGEEAAAMLATYYPSAATEFNALSYDEQDEVLAKAFGR